MYAHTATVVDNRLFIIGGRNGIVDIYRSCVNQDRGAFVRIIAESSS